MLKLYLAHGILKNESVISNKCRLFLERGGRVTFIDKEQWIYLHSTHLKKNSGSTTVHSYVGK